MSPSPTPPQQAGTSSGRSGYHLKAPKNNNLVNTSPKSEDIYMLTTETTVLNISSTEIDYKEMVKFYHFR